MGSCRLYALCQLLPLDVSTQKRLFFKVHLFEMKFKVLKKVPFFCLPSIVSCVCALQRYDISEGEITCIVSLAVCA